MVSCPIGFTGTGNGNFSRKCVSNRRRDVELTQQDIEAVAIEAKPAVAAATVTITTTTDTLSSDSQAVALGGQQSNSTSTRAMALLGVGILVVLLVSIAIATRRRTSKNESRTPAHDLTHVSSEAWIMSEEQSPVNLSANEQAQELAPLLEVSSKH